MWPGTASRKSRGENQPNFHADILAPLQQIVGPAGVPGTGRETKHLLFRRISPSACKCLGMTNQREQKGRWKPLSFQTWSSPQKDKSNLNFNITIPHFLIINEMCFMCDQHQFKSN
ncbi:hypothetical protein ATANTOWER_014935 [Ataeniobius toweri]|uniref:Uncharacterized protein n=1 Tax=Ataeniobius toweri TaxID=208326 RepID=A0ABU7A6F5_9TELE|nr:hypothetical protein [Ataeniobius toweri]